MADVACGDPGLTRELRDALTLLRDRSDDEEFRTLVDDVLAGRCSLFDASASAAFGKAVFARVTQEFTERFGHLPQEEQEAVAAEGEMQSAARCAELHRRAMAGQSGSAHGAPCGPCGGCAGRCETPGTGPSC
ncbi:MAG: hypothetical protein ACREX8_18040 [Gammaproteobacteria bacterium]